MCRVPTSSRVSTAARAHLRAASSSTAVPACALHSSSAAMSATRAEWHAVRFILLRLQTEARQAEKTGARAAMHAARGGAERCGMGRVRCAVRLGMVN